MLCTILTFRSQFPTTRILIVTTKFLKEKSANPKKRLRKMPRKVIPS